MQKREVNVTHPFGIHARPSVMIVQLASKFRCRVSLIFNGHIANARNIVAVMLLAAGAGSTITVETIGPDEREAIEALVDLIGSRFEKSISEF
jgi:phosphocarrier protein HPr